jgi:trehalose-phosphatase
MELPEGASYLPVLDAAERELHAALDPVPGCLVERKRFAIAIHYRLAADADVARAGRSAEETQAAHPELKLSAGKMVFELQPDIPWHKGKALRWLMQTLNMDPSRVVPVYIGDDQTDEDAFAELAPDGIGILVAETDRPTGATYRLDDPEAVKAFLTRIADALERR